jgi:hypothetical protein
MMPNDHDGDEKGAAMLAHVGRATKKKKQMMRGKNSMPPAKTEPMKQGMAGMNDGDGDEGW